MKKGARVPAEIREAIESARGDEPELRSSQKSCAHITTTATTTKSLLRRLDRSHAGNSRNNCHIEFLTEKPGIYQKSLSGWNKMNNLLRSLCYNTVNN